MRDPSGRLLPSVLGVLFVLMAVGQLADLPAFVDILADYDAGPPWLLALLLVTGELGAGGWLLVAPHRRPLVPAVVFAAVSVLWTVLAAQAFGRGLTVDNCGCFGVYLAQPLRWWVLIQDALLLLYSSLLLRGASRSVVVAA
ncbi:hypothetical protein BH20ACT5_BH20ACT5_25310 [soil metagenome]